jgi:hypothetical protein
LEQGCNLFQIELDLPIPILLTLKFNEFLARPEILDHKVSSAIELSLVVVVADKVENAPHPIFEVLVYLIPLAEVTDVPEVDSEGFVVGVVIEDFEVGGDTAVVDEVGGVIVLLIVLGPAELLLKLVVVIIGVV